MDDSTTKSNASETTDVSTTYLRYSDDVEQHLPDEEELVQQVVASFDRFRNMVFDKSHHAQRDAHAKSHGVLKGELRIYDDLPAHLAQGLFGEARTYPVIVRFSTSPGDVQPDNISAFYETGIKPGQQIEPEQGRAYWYQWFLNTRQGQEAMQGNARGVCRFLWQTWAPSFKFSDAEFEATAASWENPDWVEMTLHSYRVRWGAAPKNPQYAALEARLEKHPTISVPTILLHGEEDGATLVNSSAGQESSYTASYRREVLPGVGHFVQRENPQAVIEAVLGKGS